MLLSNLNCMYWSQRLKNKPSLLAFPIAGESLTQRCRKVAVSAKGARIADADEDEDDGEAPVAGKAMRVERLLANLGYGKRRECQVLVKKGRVTTRDGSKLKVGDKVCWVDMVLDGEDLDPPSPLLVALHKPVGYVVTSPDDENISDPVVYDLLPYRFARRRPFLSCVGRLDKDTSGLLLLTDDGTLLHKINSPRRGIWKVYEATLADPMTPKQAEVAARKFASGSLMLEGDYTPLLPAKMELTGDRTARVAICEGRYHQVRRMFAAVGNKVVALHRVSVGGLSLGSLPEAEWRYLTPLELQRVFEGPSAEEVLGSAIAAGAIGDSSCATTSSLPERDGGATASSSNNRSAVGNDGDAAGDVGSGKGDERRLTKKEKKKGPKDAVRKAQKSRAAAEDDNEDEDEDLDVADFELLPYDGPIDDLQGAEEVEGDLASGSQRRQMQRRQQRRAPSVRQGTVQDAKEDSIDEQLHPVTYGTSYDDVADVMMSSAAGSDVRKYRDGARWRRRRDALRQMLPS